MASQTMLTGMKFSITGTPNSHGSVTPVLSLPGAQGGFVGDHTLLARDYIMITMGYVSITSKK